jgi:hypothetical protein
MKKLKIREVETLKTTAPLYIRGYCIPVVVL